jgi:hypothetical protein
LRCGGYRAGYLSDVQASRGQARSYRWIACMSQPVGFREWQKRSVALVHGVQTVGASLLAMRWLSRGISVGCTGLSRASALLQMDREHVSGVGCRNACVPLVHGVTNCRNKLACDAVATAQDICRLSRPLAGKRAPTDGSRACLSPWASGNGRNAAWRWCMASQGLRFLQGITQPSSSPAGRRFACRR